MVCSNETTGRSVLDNGFVEVIESFGSDLTVVNTARLSYAQQVNQLNGKDIRLIHDLAKDKHFTPFRHCGITFRIKAPLMVARQWWRYSVSSAHREEQFGWNEQSRRYTEVEGIDDLYIPDYLEDDDRSEVRRAYSNALRWYERLRGRGLNPEIARVVLPAYATYTEWIWTTSLQGLGHFLKERLDSHAQSEIYEYAATVYDLAMELFPHSISALVGIRGEEYVL